MTPFHLTALSFTVVVLMQLSLRGAFRLIEKAHRRPRKPGPRNNGVQPSGEQAA